MIIAKKSGPALIGLAILVGWSNVDRPATAQPPMRQHTTVQKGPLKLVPANQKLAERSEVSVKIRKLERVIVVNGIPNHLVGRFPNQGNPHRIHEQRATYRVPVHPEQNEDLIPVGMNHFGIALNGVLFDPGAAEFWRGNPRLGWQYTALGGAVPLGLDANHGHVQPTGKYHYHGLPSGLLRQLGVQAGQHSPIIGWAADGFPIYALYGFRDPDDSESEIAKLRSSYQLKEGFRPGGRAGDRTNPGGRYDGTFLRDYQFVPGSGDLDRSNGRFAVTPDFPEGTYVYFLTEEWPVVPRYFQGMPNRTFLKRPPADRLGPGPPSRPPRRGRSGR